MSSSVDGRLRRSCWELKSDGGVNLNLAWRQSDWLCVDGEILKAVVLVPLQNIDLQAQTSESPHLYVKNYAAAVDSVIQIFLRLVLWCRKFIFIQICRNMCLCLLKCLLISERVPPAGLTGSVSMGIVAFALSQEQLLVVP